MTEFEIRKHVENTFYEIAAYFGSGIVFLVIGSLGLVERDFLTRATQELASLNTPAQIFLLVLLVSMTYAYGQLSSALSSPLIAGPVGGVVKQRGARYKGDYNADFTSIIAAYELHTRLPDTKRNNKWTLIFYLLTSQPEIGRDILKRYAREKMARINAVNMLFLTVLSASAILINLLGLRLGTGLHRYLHVPNVWFAVFCACLTCVYAYEYYLRRCWNNDLLIKVLPAVASSRKD